MSSEWTRVAASAASQRTRNPIRGIVDHLQVKPHPDKKMIPLSLGDPAVFGNLPPPPSVTRAVAEHVASNRHNGYPHSCGTAEARAAVARAVSVPGAELDANDVIVTSGCSHALLLCIDALANPGQNVLMPRPGFALYQVLCDYKGVESRHYNLLPEKSWQVDVAHLESLIDAQTAAIVINNPSNPCGSVFPREHLLELLAVAERHRLPIIADEIYGHITFGEHKFTPIASLTTEVPVLSTSGIAKQYLVPGWRMGWLTIHDRKDRLADVRHGLTQLTQLIVGSNSIVQSALPEILHDTPPEFYSGLNETLEQQANAVCDGVKHNPYLEAIAPQGTMYIMVRINVDKLDIADDMEFAMKLIAEQSVFVLPGRCFGINNFFRIVFCAPVAVLAEAMARIADFCAAHARP